MTTQNPSTVSKPAKPAWLSGCVTVIAVFFVILGILDLVYGSIITYVLAAAKILSPAKLAILLIILGDCLLYFFLAARIKRQHWLVSIVLLAVVWLVLPVALRYFINTTTMRVRNNGYAMMETLPDGVLLLADREAYRQHPPQRGDVVILQTPPSANSESNAEVLLIKRVIGLPGEEVKITQGQVLINGTPLNEPYISSAMEYRGEWKLPEGQYFVLGDNRADSRDSHQWGLLPYENIIAKVVWVYWPFTNFGKIASVNFAQ